MTEPHGPDPLRHLLAELAGDQPAVADWAGKVRGTVRARQRRRTVAVATAAVLVAALGGTAVLATDRDRVQRLTVAQASPSPAAEDCPASAPPPKPRPMLKAAVDADGIGPRDSVVTVDLDANCTTIRVGQELLVRATAQGDSATPALDSQLIGGLGSATIVDCVKGDPVPVPVEPGTTTTVLRHVYSEPGTDRVVVRAGLSCGYYRGAAMAELAIRILPAEGEPSPSVEPSVRASPSPDAGPTSPSEASDPPSGSQDIRISVTGRPEQPVAGQEWLLDIVVTGFADREPFVQGPHFDDEGPGFIAGTCNAPADPSPPPAREQRVERTARHVFDTPGRHKVELRAGASCSYYRGEDSLTFTVDVAPAP